MISFTTGINFQPTELKALPHPRVSIIMATYNQAQIIDESIQSVLNQDYQDYELIIVVDGSPDNTLDVVKKYDYPVRYIWQENQGLPGARNSGIRAARGEIIAILDGDDLYEPNFLRTMISYLEANPEADAVYCLSKFVDMSNHVLPQTTGEIVTSGQFLDKLLKGNFITPLCMVAYKYCYEQLELFDTAIPKCNDWDMWLQFAKHYKVIGLNKALGRYRVVPQSMSSSNPMPMLEDRIAVLQKHFGRQTLDLSTWTNDERLAYAYCYLTTTVEYLQIRNTEQAYNCLRNACTASPQLLAQFDFFYELGCGDQPRGFRGHLPTLDIEYNAKVLTEMLNRLFTDSQMLPILQKYKRMAYANAYFALGVLYYNANHFSQARKFLGDALTTNLRLSWNRRLIATFFKTLLKAHIRQ